MLHEPVIEEVALVLVVDEIVELLQWVVEEELLEDELLELKEDVLLDEVLESKTASWTRGLPWK